MCIGAIPLISLLEQIRDIHFEDNYPKCLFPLQQAYGDHGAGSFLPKIR
jgi:hypothetical protein